MTVEALEQLSKAEQWRGGKVLLHTSTHRPDLFTWMESLNIAWANTLVDTWQIDDHPDGKGGTFTLYACTVVVLSR